MGFFNWGNNEKEQERNYALNIAIDYLTSEEADDLNIAVQKNKRKIAPKAHGRFAKGEARHLGGWLKNRELESGDIDG